LWRWRAAGPDSQRPSKAPKRRDKKKELHVTELDYFTALLNVTVIGTDSLFYSVDEG
jgi:hypothetical protein